jgi:hypothetical protein
MIKKNYFGSKYVSAVANIGSWGTTNRGKHFSIEADIEQSKASDVPNRISKTNS